MNNLTTKEIRKIFLNFFSRNNHKIINYNSLIPKENDRSLLFINSGMVPFKNIFLGLDKPPYKNITSSQYCIRTGGKHNDLKNIGNTNYHHTLFEMLGNFSFGGYFKYEAIQLAWELLTSSNGFNIPKEKLLITTHINDDESYSIWKKKIKISDNRILNIGNKKNPQYSDNFWTMGNTGPCGPCTEIFYDKGTKILNNSSKKNNIINNKKYIEIWNLVFIQYDLQITGELKPLSKLFIDTGMGLERIASILQNTNSNYEIDVFKKIISIVSEILYKYNLNKKTLLIISDHIRTCLFLIHSKIIPSNEGRGYILRLMIRRIIKYGYLSGIKTCFLYKLTDPITQEIESFDEKIKFQKKITKKILHEEEKNFFKKINAGINILNNKLSNLKNNVLDGKTAFKLHDTYGLPIDLTINICKTKNIKIDKINFKKNMNIQKNKSRNFKKKYFN